MHESPPDSPTSHMETSQIEVESQAIELATQALKAFCGEISGMFGVDMECQRREIAAETVAGLQKRFKKPVAVNIVDSEGALSGTFQFIFDHEGLFILGGITTMQSEQMILANRNDASPELAGSMVNAMSEAGNLLVASWERVYCEELAGHSHFSHRLPAFVGSPWDRPEGTMGLAGDQELVFIPYEMTIGSYPAFNCGVIFPKTIFRESSDFTPQEADVDGQNNQEVTEENPQEVTEENAQEVNITCRVSGSRKLRIFPLLSTQEVIEENAQEVAEENTQEATEENSQEVTEENTQETTGENPQEVTEENVQEVTEENPQEVAEENAQEVTEENTQEAAEENAQEVDGENTQEVTEENPQEVAEENAQEVTGENAQKVDEENPQEVTEKNAQEATEENAKEVTGENAQDMQTADENTNTGEFDTVQSNDGEESEPQEPTAEDTPAEQTDTGDNADQTQPEQAPQDTADSQETPAAQESVAKESQLWEPEVSSEQQSETAAENAAEGPSKETAAASETGEEPTTGKVSDAIQKITQSPAVLPGGAGHSATTKNAALISGENLRICAEDIMQKNVLRAGPDDSLQQALAKMRQTDAGYIMIEQDGVLEGIVSKSDITGAMSPYLQPIFSKWRRPLDDATLKIRIKWIMSRPVRTIKPQTPLAAIVEHMSQFRGRCLAVTDEAGEVQGLVTAFDIFEALLNGSPKTSAAGEIAQTPAEPAALTESK